MTTFGERLRAWREARNVTTYDIEKAGIDRSNYKKVERGERAASPEMLRQIAGIPKMDISYDTLRAWQRVEDASFGEKLEIIKELVTEDELLELVRQAILEKRTKFFPVDQ